jgi:hypothetical protein
MINIYPVEQLDKYHRRKRRNKDVSPPFAGIILIRFCGYFSAIPNIRKSTPGTACAKFL